MNWTAFGTGTWRYCYDHVAQMVRSPRLDAEHYREQERIYVEWIESMRRAGVPAPNLMLACFLWLCGIACTRMFSRWWLRGLVAATLAWMVRAFFVPTEDRDGRVGS